MGKLYTATRDLHHACEVHPVGCRMADGTVTPQEWADWLAAFRAIHVRIDPYNPRHLARVALLDADLELLPRPRKGPAVARLVKGLTTPTAVNAASYVLHGAHRRGGRVLCATMGRVGLPTAHVFYPDAPAAEAFVRDMRDAPGIAPDARAVFEALLATMDEIEDRRGEEAEQFLSGLTVWGAVAALVAGTLLYLLG